MRWLIAAVVALAASWIAAQESSAEEEPRTLRVCGHQVPQTCVTYSTTRSKP
jgi:hypothetical protein